MARGRDTGPWRSMADLFEHVRELGVSPRTLVDVGVGYGTPHLYKSFPDAALVLVEPLAEVHPLIDELRETRTVHLAPVAAGAAAGTAVLMVHPVATLSSTAGARRGDGVRPEAREVPVRTLDEIWQETRADAPCVLKIDVEGSELAVLEGASEVLARTVLAVIEASFFELNEGAAQASDLVAAMRDRGFVLYDIVDGHRRPLDGALAQADFVFVPRSSPLRAEHAYATEDEARSLYGSWGFEV